MVTDHDRRELYEALHGTLGERPATTLMELLPPVGWADVARRSDLVAIRGEMGELRGEMAVLRGEMAELRGEIKALRTEMQGEINALRTEMQGELNALRTELRNETGLLRAQMQSQFAKFIFANMPIMFGTAALVLGAAKLA